MADFGCHMIHKGMGHEGHIWHVPLTVTSKGTTSHRLGCSSGAAGGQYGGPQILKVQGGGGALRRQRHIEGRGYSRSTGRHAGVDGVRDMRNGFAHCGVETAPSHALIAVAIRCGPL